MPPTPTATVKAKAQTHPHQRRFKATLTDGVHAMFRLPKQVAEAHLPNGIETRPRGRFAYASVLIAPLQSLRPAGVPTFEGLNDTVAVYALLTRTMSTGADTIDGHWVLGMETGRASVEVLQDYLPQFPWQPAAITYQADREGVRIQIDHTHGNQSHLHVGTTRPVLPRGSSFPTPIDAQTFCQLPARLWSRGLWKTDLTGATASLQPTLTERVRLSPIERLSDNCFPEWTQRITRPIPITLLPPHETSSMAGPLQDRLTQTDPKPKNASEPSPAYA